MKRRRRSSGYEAVDEAGINLTPLIDVVFVVLIMFIIVAPMLELDRVQLASAPLQRDKKIAAVEEKSQIAIHVRADNTIWFNNRALTEAELLSLLKEARRTRPDQIPQLFHDKRGYFGTYQAVKNAVELAGFDEMDVILEPR
jgi:biopolymer transport protein ExbD